MDQDSVSSSTGSVKTLRLRLNTQPEELVDGLPQGCLQLLVTHFP